MATNQSTVDFIEDQLSSIQGVRSRKMFGEYALYIHNKVIGLICDDTLYIKITPEGKTHVGEHYQEGNAYPGAKPSMVIPAELIEDRDWLTTLATITADNLPTPKPKTAAKK